MDKLTQADSVLADKAYDADERMRDKLREKNCQAAIPSKKNRIEEIPYDKDLYKNRHLIENFYCKIKQFRAIATRYDKTSQNFLGAVYLVGCLTWLI